MYIDTPEEAAAKKSENESKMKEIQEIEVKSGDYSIQVHIIEARDLKAENLDGTSDPVCYIEMFGQKQNTSTKKSCTSCVYDELMIFSFRNMDKDEFKDGVISISVRDSNSIPGGLKPHSYNNKCVISGISIIVICLLVLLISSFLVLVS